MESIYDCAVIGAGPAGLSAALYMGRMRRSVVVVDDNQGRSNWHQVNRNYIGFPDGVHARSLREIGREQVHRYGAKFVDACVQSVAMEDENDERRFRINTTSGNLAARTLIFATGVHDQFPDFEGRDICVGKSLFWCIICDGYEAIDKRIVVLGSNNRAASLALQLLVFTPHVSVVPWKKPLNVTDARRATLLEHGVTVHSSFPRSYNCGSGGQLASLTLEDGTEVPMDSMFVVQWIEPNAQLAESLGVTVDEHGFIVVDVEQSTNIPGVYAAGDVTRLFNHQISSAVHEGGMAAAAANFYLYEEWQKE